MVRATHKLSYSIPPTKKKKIPPVFAKFIFRVCAIFSFSNLFQGQMDERREREETRLGTFFVAGSTCLSKM